MASETVMAVSKPQWLVVSDLDGTMLDHHSYDVEDARAAVHELQDRRIPVLLNTSKTYAETIAIRETLGIEDAFIVENGSCIYLPRSQFSKPDNASERDDYWSIVLGASHRDIDDVLQHIGLTEDAAVRLSQCTVEQTIELTGLNEAQARQAIAREYSEPLIWRDDDSSLRSFQQALKEHGLTTLQGGRFLHVIGDCDKGRATRALSSLYGDNVKTIVLGDSANDAAMLSVADISVIVNSPSNHQLQEMITPDIKTRQPAPKGWREAIEQSLERILLIEE
ncbi:MAG: HAD-IIB family hydrolase [Gammaproteobacteria bacterium]|nr:HAD-IIB family hydrolase [Gammaproteobacteria bacterium]NNJ50451.1 HAD-IIB family hydrolase [Gammaproteobacteria bacterium]